MTMTFSQSAIEAALDAFNGCKSSNDIDAMEAALTAALAVDGVALQGWQPIESAPKDGSWFMICRDEEGPDSYEVGRHEPMYFDKYKETEPGSGLYRVVKERFGHDDWRGFNNFHRATHWMPLPQPPAASDGEERK